MSEIGKMSAHRPRAEQLPLDFAHAAARGRDDLLVNDRLEAAVQLIDRWPDWPAPVVVLVGPAGSGKSHLAAIWRAASAAVPIEPVAAAADRAIAAAEAGPVLFEDADRRPFDQDVLFHVINAVRAYGRQLLITSRASPLSWPVTLADLRSRLRAATVCEIATPDEALLSQLLVKLFSDRQLYIDDKLVDYILGRMDRSFDAALVVVERLDRLALARRSRISRALAAEVLAAMADGGDTEDRGEAVGEPLAPERR